MLAEVSTEALKSKSKKQAVVQKRDQDSEMEGIPSAKSYFKCNFADHFQKEDQKG